MATKEELNQKISENASNYSVLAEKVSDINSQQRAAARKVREYQQFANAAAPEARSAYLEEVARYQSEADQLQAQSESVYADMDRISEAQSNLQRQINELDAASFAATQNANPASTVKTIEATNESQTDQDTAEKYADTTRVPDPSIQRFDDGSSLQTFDDGSSLATDAEGKISASSSTDVSSEEFTRENRSKVPAGAERNRSVTRASAEWAETKDLRIIIRTPKTYLKGPAAGPSGILNDFGGILFPYTPIISYDNQAVYGSVSPVHSNYTQYFYKNSQVGQISISGKFTVQNEREGKIWLGVVHLLRALTKMRWGTDADAGSPPPVCRLEAYGDFMLRNVPVVIASFKFDLPDNVDYMSIKGEYKNTLVPIISTLSLSLNVMYSRRELQEYSVDKWIQGNLRGQGYL